MNLLNDVMLSDVMFWREAITVAAFGLFVGIVVWSYSRKRDQEFQEVSMRVIHDDDTDFADGDRP
ncbi:MAG TPA: CcoQ/FixQ family Cbb3-type cytochrome c oxidase assembly chaperone [Limnobacter sp.]|uniref:CcoQ/FixQ family Cbb3-type cytochrome c oxidase assembly chaperone n=1 Tax=Limnobacter sp. TaxID=2003368 RepID=UPI002EDB327F